MRRELVIHPDFACPAVRSIEVGVRRRADGELVLAYSLAGDLDALVVPPPAPAVRADELWKHTCFEAFVAAPDGAYVELNFTPSTAWAAYAFTGYRADMAALDLAHPPAIAPDREPGRFTLAAVVDLPRAGPWRVAVSAVIEDAAGQRSYWALAHPPGKPDFHHQDGFVLELPEP